MNWYTYRRARGALILILLGVMFLLQEMHIFHWANGWPLFLIGLGIILLLERLIPGPPLPPMPPPMPPVPGQYQGQYPGQYPYGGYPPPPGPYSAPPAQPYGMTAPPSEPATESKDPGPFSR